MKNTITLVMIVKNESENLGTCLDSVRDQVDEIVIVDTGSTDNTLEVAAKYTDKVYFYLWDEDFSAARNYAIARAGGDWILFLDADESLVCEPGQLKELVSRDNKIDAYMLPLDYPIAKSTDEYNRFLVLRLFRNNKGYHFKGKIHEQVVVHNHEVVGLADNIFIKHSMISPKERNRKRGRNLTALKKAISEEPDNYFLQYYIGVEWLGLGKPARALPFLQSAYQNLTDNHLLFRAPSLRYLLICLNALGNYDQTICLSQETAFKYPDYTDIYYLGGIAFEEKAEYKLAIKWLEQAVKCGVPPVIYSHMNGTGGFLAHYHLGFCYEKLGQVDVAQECYERALEVNDSYIYPVCNLFLLMLGRFGPGYTLNYFKKKGYLKKSDLALTVADLFFNSGYPGLAKGCLELLEEISHKTEEVVFQLGRYNIYSGRFQMGLNYMVQIPEASDLFTTAQTHRAVALLLAGRFKEGRNLGLEMWKNKMSKDTARAVLTLSNFMQGEEILRYPAKVNDLELMKSSITLLDMCYHYLPDRDGQRCPYLNQVISILEKMITGSSPDGYLTLEQYYKNKSNNLKEFFNYKFGTGGFMA
ncbi:glycosyl transferase, family 2 [Desulforamulus reducens MI-1]|uniref:Glycosyl transferase, family 2 n=1 Tax=Desulforamulus reducens (strain ATCC BAA-1160 / DSM 100696 / MI-1) TaxID=349161 RepID=A4J4D6_DESRM|nr:glycosyltransferase [Desulforamulus reducens]ABO49939.1 glycosyl transferase, family 2 [Desulforamulus reducens MI-1]